MNKDELMELNNLGYKYEIGDGVEQDLKKACEYYKKAAEGGLPIAQSNYGLFLSNGRGCRKNMKKAVEMFKAAADAGEPGGLFYYGMLFFYAEGGMPQDYAKAFEYVQRSADGKFGYAYNALSVMYERGLGVKQDKKQADKWHKLAEEAGCVEEL